jgi:hypothetical protein
MRPPDAALPRGLLLLHRAIRGAKLRSMSERIGASFRVAVLAITLCGALAIAAALVVMARGRAFEGFLIVLSALLLLRWYWRATVRTRALARRRFFVGQRVGTHWVYEELHGGIVVSLELPLDYLGRGEYEIHVPSDRAWRATMPDWARDRRDQIVERLGRVFKRSQIHFDPDSGATPTADA